MTIVLLDHSLFTYFLLLVCLQMHNMHILKSLLYLPIGCINQKSKCQKCRSGRPGVSFILTGTRYLLIPGPINFSTRPGSLPGLGEMSGGSSAPSLSPPSSMSSSPSPSSMSSSRSKYVETNQLRGQVRESTNSNSNSNTVKFGESSLLKNTYLISVKVTQS